MNSLTIAIHQFTTSVDDLHADFAERYGLSVQAMLILNQLYKEDCVMASALARSVGREPTSFTPILDRMAEAGFIQRQPHPKDRRVVMIVLTDKARTLEKDIVAHMEKVEQRLKDMLSARIFSVKTVDALFAPLPETQASQVLL